MDKVQHFEIPADDLKRAQGFYEKSFGWKMKDWPMPDGSTYTAIYTGPVDEKNKWKEPGFINGGMVKRGGAFPIKAPSVSAIVTDIDATLKKIEKAGGKVVMPKAELMGMGQYAYVQDTEGNVIGVWQEAEKK